MIFAQKNLENIFYFKKLQDYTGLLYDRKGNFIEIPVQLKLVLHP